MIGCANEGLRLFSEVLETLEIVYSKKFKFYEF